MGAGFGDGGYDLRALHGFQVFQLGLEAGLPGGGEMYFFQGVNSGLRPF
jgi:hypothetical protein